MYYSYQLYTRNMGLSYCISIKSAFLNFVLLVGTFWHLREMSEFPVVRDELVLILLVGIKEWTGMVLEELEWLVSGLVQEMKVNECSENKC